MTEQKNPTELLTPYLPRLLVQWLAEDPDSILREIDGSVVFVDISGFTKMSERLARKGKVGAEEVTEVLGSVFAQLLAVAYGNGGGLLKFGGDALLLFFSGEGHPTRAVRSAFGMRRTLRSIGRLETSAGLITLRMSVGVHSGVFQFFLVGDSHRELMITGPAASTMVDMEGTATAGEILLSRALADVMPDSILGAAKGEGVLLRREPPGLATSPAETTIRTEGLDLSRCIPVAIRDHLLSGAVDPEHRQVTVAFIHFDGVDEMVRTRGAQAVAEDLHVLVCSVQAAADRRGGHVPRHRRRPRRRQDHPRRRRAAGARRRRGADAARGARHRGVEPADPRAHRRERGPRLRRRHRPPVPAHVHGHGRRGEPRRARDGEGRAGRGARDGRACSRPRRSRSRPPRSSRSW